MTLGLQRNNPWDLLPEHIPWIGLDVKQPDSGPLAFETLVEGIRAGVRVCYSYQREGFNTPTHFVYRYAPPPQNPTVDYIAHVCAWTGFRFDQLLDFHDVKILTPWAWAVWRQEQGAEARRIITPADLAAGIEAAQ